MAKIVFSNGDCVKGKKWGGDEILGVYEYNYDDGSHCVLEASSGKRFNIKPKDLHMANEEEEKDIKRLLKENHLKPYAKGETPKPTKKETEDEELSIALAGDEATEETQEPIEGQD